MERTSVDFAAQQARNVVLYGECLKPRIIFAQHALSTDERNCIEKAKESAEARWTGPVDWTSGLDYWTHLFT